MSKETEIMKILDCRGETCPTPYIKSKRALSKMKRKINSKMKNRRCYHV